MMVRYIMTFDVPEGRQQSARKIIGDYFEQLQRQGPGGMRSQCYSTQEDDCSFVHIKSFRKESVAHQHFRSGSFRDYIRLLGELCGRSPSFARLSQQKTFESIY